MKKKQASRERQAVKAEPVKPDGWDDGTKIAPKTMNGYKRAQCMVRPGHS